MLFKSHAYVNALLAVANQSDCPVRSCKRIRNNDTLKQIARRFFLTLMNDQTPVANDKRNNRPKTRLTIAYSFADL